MKKMYWRPRRVSRTVLSLIAVSALAGYAAVERLRSQIEEPYYEEKLAAARLTEKAFKIIREARAARGITLDSEADPAQSGLIGTLVTPITTNPGVLAAKQTSVNPNFAAVIVHYLLRAGVGEGDTVAIGYSGSFPAINIAVLAAVETLHLKPIIISSASSSQWGANEPEFTWLDMERVLFDAGIFSHRSVAASVGGIEDRGLGLSKRSQTLIAQAIARAELPQLTPESYENSIEQRMLIYRENADHAPIKAYINVGGGTTSVGKKVGKLTYKPGLNRSTPAGISANDSIMARFLDDGVPVVHLVKVTELANRFGLAIQPRTLPAPGEGKIYARERYNLWLTSLVLVVIIGALYLFVRSDLGFRLTRGSGKRTDTGHPEPMV